MGQSDKTHCPQQHEYTPENTYVHDGSRYCAQCRRDAARAHKASVRERKRAAGEFPRYEDTTPSVYFISDAFGNVKIGVAADPTLRCQDMQVSHAGELRVEAVIPGGYPAEARLHAQFSDARLRGEWFSMTPEIAHYIDICQELTA